MTVIKGTGSVIPELVVPNSQFAENVFYDKDGNRIPLSGAEMAAKLEAISGIRERRYVPFDQDSRPLMIEGARRAVADSGLEPDELDGIIVSHNAGNILIGEHAFHTVPNMAAIVKHDLDITNHECFAYDILFACPGWLQGVIQAHQAIECGSAGNVLVVGVEVASRMLDPHDVDSMLLGDGCGAAVFSRGQDRKGILSHATFSHANKDIENIYLGRSNKEGVPGNCWFKMNGREVYRYATTWVPKVVKKALEAAGLALSDVDMFLFHQANEKLIEAAAANLAQLYDADPLSLEGKLPMTVQFLGNSSVATVPTLLDLILKGELDGYEINEGDTVVFASVGAGMHCNAMVYRF